MYGIDAGAQGLLRKYTCFICSPVDQPARVGSGTLIRIRDQLLVCTASHVLEGLAGEQIGLLNWYEGDESAYPIPQGGGRIDSGPDIGFIRLHACALKGSHLEGLPISRLKLGTNHVGSGPIVVAGIPAESVSIDSPRSTLEFKYHAILAETIPPAHWPSICGYKSRIDRDLFVKYSKSDAYNPDATMVRPIDPEGLSGGRIWEMPVPHLSSGLWTPNEARLIGIQVAMAADSWSWLHGIQIHYWLCMVFDQCKDLQDDIRPLLQT